MQTHWHEKIFPGPNKKAANKGTKIQFSITPPHPTYFFISDPYEMQQDAIAGSQGRLNEKFIALRKKQNQSQTRT
jgi:hypothetical protein